MTVKRIKPEGSITLTRKDAPGAVAYVVNGSTGVRVVAYEGRMQRPRINMTYLRDGFRARAEKDVKGFFDAVALQVKLKAKRKAEAQPTPEQLFQRRPFKVGDLLAYSWGYDQTNYDFFEVVARTAKTVKIRPLMKSIEATGDMSAKERPLPGQFKGERVYSKLEQFNPDGEPMLAMDFGVAKLTHAFKAHHSTSYA